jgi:phage terminase small subunit
MASDKSLTNKQQLFIYEYLKCFNATRAAIAAGYSEQTARQQGSRLLSNVDIARAIEAFMQENAMSAAEVIHHLTQIARGDMDELIDDKGNLDIYEARQHGSTNLIKRIRQRSITTEQSDIHEAEIEPYDRLKALELLAKYRNLTTTTRIEDWRSDAIADIQAQKIAFEPLADELGEDLASELFALAGVPIAQTRED